jgi:glutamate racemase
LHQADYQTLRACKKIGLFDSGLGGLSVLRRLGNFQNLNGNHSGKGSLLQELVSNNTSPLSRQFMYVGDTARCPYGDRPSAEIVSYVGEIIRWLTTTGGADAIVMACNTSAALAFDVAQKISPVPVFDLILPTARHAVRLGRKVGVMATSSTIRSRAFSKAIHSQDPSLEVVEMACPDLVPLVETGRIAGLGTEEVLSQYIEKLVKEKVEVLILGCTHFPFLSKTIEKLIDGRMQLLDPALILCDLIYGESRQVAPIEQMDTCKILVTGDAIDFARTAEICLGYNLGTIYSIGLDELVQSDLVKPELVGTSMLDSVSSLANIISGSSASNSTPATAV